MICPLCKNNTLCIDVIVGIRIPAEFEGHISKKLLQSKLAELLYAEWDSTLQYCRTPGCGSAIQHNTKSLESV